MKNIKRIGVLVVFGMLVFVMCVPTPSAQTWAGRTSSSYSYAIVIDADNDAEDEVWAIFHDGAHNSNPPGEELLRVQENGNIGIRTPDPTERLDVNGSVRVRELSQDNTLDDIVVADENGVLHTRDLNTIGFAFSIITVYDDYTPVNSDYTILMDASSNNVRILLPPAADVPGQVLVLKRVDDNKTNKVIIDPDGSETIDGRLHIRLRIKFMSYTIQSDGFDWYIIASYGFMGRSHLNNKNR